MLWSDRLQALIATLARFPWKTTAATLRERFRADQLGVTAGSLTFTTTIALVPLVTVALAVFTAFPMFAKLQDVLQKWLVESLVPDNIARQVLGYLTQFAGKAGRLGWTGFIALMVSAFALILTIDRCLNRIWRVRRPRPLGQRVLVYWAVLTLGPLLLGMSLSVTSWAISASRGLVGAPGPGLRLLLDVVEFVLLALGMTGLFRYVPNTPVAWAHALSGGIFVAVGVEVAKRLLAVYLKLVPTYSAVYGTFATVPILLVWIYVVWVLVLLGAVIAAYLPSLLAGVARRGGTPGWLFQLAIEVLGLLQRARAQPPGALTAAQLARALRVELLQLEPVLDALKDLHWLGQLSEPDEHGATRYVLLADPAQTPLAPLMDRLLLAGGDTLLALRRATGWESLMLADALDGRAAAP